MQRGYCNSKGGENGTVTGFGKGRHISGHNFQGEAGPAEANSQTDQHEGVGVPSLGRRAMRGEYKPWLGAPQGTVCVYRVYVTFYSTVVGVGGDIVLCTLGRLLT